ncbi:MAG: hypothetical protein J6X94_04770 [Lachnospiraceae bacterium]|nr:hypothetical protein [Lachnospiraceae bacterium]
MLNTSFDRDSIIVKIMGIISGLAAIGSLVILFLGGDIGSLFIAIANGLLAFICFVDYENEKIFFVGSLGFIALTEVINLISKTGVFSTSYTNIIISILAHLGMIAYILWNRISRNQAMWIGAVCVGDILWKAIMLPSMLRRFADVLGIAGLGETEMNAVIALVVIAALVAIIPAAAVTIFLFTGALDYGN